MSLSVTVCSSRESHTVFGSHYNTVQHIPMLLLTFSSLVTLRGQHLKNSPSKISVGLCVQWRCDRPELFQQGVFSKCAWSRGGSTCLTTTTRGKAKCRSRKIDIFFLGTHIFFHKKSILVQFAKMTMLIQVLLGEITTKWFIYQFLKFFIF